MASRNFSNIFPTNLICISTFLITVTAISSEQFAKTEEMTSVNKMTHLHFYLHNIVSGENATATTIFKGGKNNVGLTVLIDDPLTEGTENGSKILGRAQGMYAVPTKGEVALLMVMNFAFLEGKYNGSTISILGRNPVFHKVREMPVVGGSGLFRFSRGYALAKTIGLDTDRDAVVEYNVAKLFSRLSDLLKPLNGTLRCPNL